MNTSDAAAIVARNKASYSAAKQAFNANDMAACLAETARALKPRGLGLPLPSAMPRPSCWSIALRRQGLHAKGPLARQRRGRPPGCEATRGLDRLFRACRDRWAKVEACASPTSPFGDAP
jgi:hypothetical protein